MPKKSLSFERQVIKLSFNKLQRFYFLPGEQQKGRTAPRSFLIWGAFNLFEKNNPEFIHEGGQIGSAE